MTQLLLQKKFDPARVTRTGAIHFTIIIVQRIPFNPGAGKRNIAIIPVIDFDAALEIIPEEMLNTGHILDSVPAFQIFVQLRIGGEIDVRRFLVMFPVSEVQSRGRGQVVR